MGMSTKQASLNSLKQGQSAIERIKELKRTRNAVILAHYYQAPDIQDIADFVGDSLELSRKAANTESEVIVFCGVHFMAETAKILNPEKTVLIPDIEAGCTLADECPGDEFKKFCNKYPGHFKISYINCSAEVKAQSDLICTSSNAVNLVNQIPRETPIIFAPDRNLGKWVENQCNRKLVLWPGSCIVHESFSEEALLKLQLESPEAEILAHPECQPHLLDFASYIGSTSKLLQRAKESENQKFIVLTEPGIIHQMKKHLPNKEFIDVPGIDGCSCNECPYMRLNTRDKIISSLTNLQPKLEINEEIRKKALKPIELMLKMSN